MAHPVTTYLERSSSFSVGARKSPFLTFTCLPAPLQEAVAAFFKKAVAGEAYLDMHPNLSCGHNEVAAGCGNLRGTLAECRCEVLDRKRYPNMRTDYEDRVIRMVLDLVKTRVSHLKLAIFCSGRLLGEEILLFRLFNQLKGKALGRLQLFFIDRCYSGAILKQAPEDYMSQFLTEISQYLPKGMKCDVTFFGEADDYMSLAESRGETFKHDLLIGADIYSSEAEIEKNNRQVAEIAKRAGLRQIHPIILTQVKKGAAGPFEGQICRVNDLGKLIDCFTTDSSAASANKLKSRNIGITVGVIGGVIFLVLFFIFILPLINRKNKGTTVTIDVAGQ